MMNTVPVKSIVESESDEYIDELIECELAEETKEMLEENGNLAVLLYTYLYNLRF